ncbi:MAG: hypothetical protein COB08_010145 [Rhodobacteraceae bacterium]|nr:hypothetical protein [Paracoccaceae bacterium]
MTDHSILFQHNMVEALQAGRKTQTRRMLKPQPKTFIRPDSGKECLVYPLKVEGRNYTNIAMGLKTSGVITEQKIPYQTGDRLWVKEAHWALGHWQETGELKKNGKPKLAFSRAFNEPVRFAEPDYTKSFPRDTTFGWYKRNSLFHPKADSRTTLLITDVRVQRLQDIRSYDALWEGIDRLTEPDGFRDYLSDASTARLAMVPSFKSLINSINGPDTWEQNPWVVAYSFQVQHRNVDKV